MSATKETSNISGYHDKTPIYIDGEILQEAVLEQGLQDQAERIAKEEGILYQEALRLSLEYRSELKNAGFVILNVLRGITFFLRQTSRRLTTCGSSLR